MNWGTRGSTIDPHELATLRLHALPGVFTAALAPEGLALLGPFAARVFGFFRVSRHARKSCGLHLKMAVHLRNTKVVLHDLNLHIPDGSRVAVIGQNGTGKSTLLQFIFWHAATDQDLMLRTCPTAICIDNEGIRCQVTTAEVLDIYRNG